MNVMYYLVSGVIVFIVMLAALVVNNKKLKATKADAADKATRLERYAPSEK